MPGYLAAIFSPLFARRGALGEEGDAFEQVHGPVELRVMDAQHSLALLIVEA